MKENFKKVFTFDVIVNCMILLAAILCLCDVISLSYDAKNCENQAQYHKGFSAGYAEAMSQVLSSKLTVEVLDDKSNSENEK
jgi:hypothetical protein